MQINSHPFSQEQLMAYLDGELPGNEAAIAAAHLQHCRECQELAADLQSVSRHLSAWQIDKPSPALIDQLGAALNALRLKKTEKFAWFPFFVKHRWPLGLLVSSAVLLVAISAVFWQHPRVRRSSELYLPEYSGLQKFARLDGAAPVRSSSDAVGGNSGEFLSVAPPPPLQPAAPSGPIIIRTAQLSLTTNDFPHIRESISRILTSREGYIAQLEMSTPAGEARSLDTTLRIPATQLDAALIDLKRLGHVDAESQRGEEVTQRVVDIQARLSNLRITEARLTDILRQRTGKLADVLAVEEQIGSVRGQIENIEAEQKTLNKQIAFAAVQLRVREEYKKPLALNNNSLSTRLRNATIEGFQTLADGAIGLLLFFLSYGPTLLVIAALLFYPALRMWKHRQRVI
ncbi:MAG: DUF4349 domain-containing protein [Acidobacteriaceae bacterium]|nr:DUF4349 domain-containing protein [Acidobacteriaceae bacterium]